MIRLPDRGGERDKADRHLDEEELIEESGDEAAEAEIADTPLAAALTQIKLADRSFDKDEFLGGGRAAFEMIVADYAAGDATSPRPLLATDLYADYADAIPQRQAAKET